MATRANSFHITDVIYDADLQKLTYKYIEGGTVIERVGIGFTSIKDIVEDFENTLTKYFAKS